ncbi:MAG: AAA family ATPase [Bacteroides sp.]|nr:AAA family ATPase [Bacteroides sp.]MCM1086053.1 AAA family ATPase [Bacteroides sp.]MCM1169946.1 AAA family ATPase [Bacteroides sp.]
MKAYESDKSEFVAVYGRRRVGKTYLVRETFHGKFAFSYSGMANVSTKMQLQAFHASLVAQGGAAWQHPRNWIDAFTMLAQFLSRKKGRKKVVFLDELPWMDGPKSSFLPAFEHFWNNWASARKDILLIVCGSATSWIINKIVKNHGGLHNRLTFRIPMEQFTLRECEAYAASLKLNLTRPMLLEAYMIFGGVPYYWSQLNGSLSLSQNIDELFFRKAAVFDMEYNELYSSLFKRPEAYIDIVTALGKKKIGMTRAEIAKAVRLDANGKLTRCLEELEACGFIRRYSALGMKTKNAVFQLIDNFTLFYFKFLDSPKHTDGQFWSKNRTTPAFYNWSGLAFERVCLLHTEQIKRALGIGGILTGEYAWRALPENGNPGTEIDLLIDRADKAINICEIKYTSGKFGIDKKYASVLRNKAACLRVATKTSKAIFITMITAEGLVKNEYVNEVHNSLNADILFE